MKNSKLKIQSSKFQIQNSPPKADPRHKALAGRHRHNPSAGTAPQAEKCKNRISWDKYFFEIAKLASRRSTCLRIREGAVIVRDKRILTTGYNGAPVKLPHCLEIGCMREERGLKESNEQLEICRGLDAIQNAVIQAVICGVAIRDSVLYTTFLPSPMSVKIIVNAGIKKIFIPVGKLEKLAAQILRQSKVKIDRMK